MGRLEAVRGGVLQAHRSLPVLVCVLGASATHSARWCRVAALTLDRAGRARGEKRDRRRRDPLLPEPGAHIEPQYLPLPSRARARCRSWAASVLPRADRAGTRRARKERVCRVHGREEARRQALSQQEEALCSDLEEVSYVWSRGEPRKIIES